MTQCGLRILSMAVGLVLAAYLTAADSAIVVVTVRPRVEVPGLNVTVGDAAAVEGGPAALRQQIARLDLADLSPDRPSATVSREQVAYRIRLAGIDPALFRVEGATQAQLTLERCQVTTEEMETAVRQAVLRRLPWKPDDVDIVFVKPVPKSLTLPGTRAEVRLEAELRAGPLPLGRVNLDLAVYVRGERRQAVPVSLDVKAYQKVAVCKRRVERGEPLSDDNVLFDRRVVQGLNSYVTPGDSLLGKRAKHALQPGQVLSAHDVESGAPLGPVLVKQRELVKAVARLGPLQVTTVAEALQEGRDGQWIRVRNVDSKKVVVGRVVAKATVEVDH